MSNIMKTHANKLREEFVNMSDSELYFYSMDQHSKTFESIPEHIKRVAEEYIKSLPF